MEYMPTEPILSRSGDGTVTMEWHGPDRCLVAREIMELLVTEHNELVRLRQISPADKVLPEEFRRLLERCDQVKSTHVS